MKSARPKALHAVAGRSMLGARARGGARRGRLPHRGGRRARSTGRQRGRAPHRPSGGDLHAERAARHGPCRASGASGAGARLRTTWSSPSPTRLSCEPPLSGACARPLADGAAVVVLGFEARDPTGYGRLVTKDGRLPRSARIGTPRRRSGAITLCNGGLMALRGDIALTLLDRIGNRNAQGRVLPDGRGGGRRLARRGGRDRHRLGGRGAGHQRSGPARQRRARHAGAPAPGGHGERGDAGRAGDGVLQRRHEDRPRRGDRAPRGISGRASSSRTGR